MALADGEYPAGPAAQIAAQLRAADATTPTEGEYPAGPAARIADQLRARDSTTPSQAGGSKPPSGAGYPETPPVATPTSSFALLATGALPPTAEIPSQQAQASGPLLMGIPSRHAAAQEPLLMGIPSRQAAAQEPKPGPPALIPGMPSRQTVNQGPALLLPLAPANAQRSSAAAQRQSNKENWVTPTITTPMNRGTHIRSRPKPVPITSLVSSQSGHDAGEHGQKSFGSGIGCRRGRNSSSISTGVGPSALTQTSGLSAEEGSTSTSPSSMTSSVLPGDNSFSWSRGNTRFDSNNSFRWTPEVLVQSWHRQLSETYSSFNMVDVLGEGRSGAVIIVQHKISEQYMACKILNKVDNRSKDLQAEIETLRRLDHPNVVRLYETNEDKDAVFLLMELCQGGDLFSRIVDQGTLPEREARLFAEQMLSALAYCHKKGVVHRDVKPENFLLESTDPDWPVLKLADFGIATQIRSAPADDADAVDVGLVNGSLPYMAPELFRHTWKSLITAQEEVGKKDSFGMPSSGMTTLAASDLWSCGVVIYVMLSGDLPYGEDVDAISSGEPPDFSKEVWQGISAEATDLMRQLMNPDVKDRCTAREALDHKWFRMDASPAIGDTDLPGIEQPGDSFGDGKITTQRRGDAARELMRCLKHWRDMNKLRRMCIAPIAKRLEEDHPSKRFARTAYRVFSGTNDVLRCDHLVQEMAVALNEACVDAKDSGVPTPVSEGSFTSNSSRSTTSSRTKSVTGLHVRDTIRNSFKQMSRRVSRISEETPTSGSPVGDTPSGDSFDPLMVDVGEIRKVVSALSGMKSDTVDYTLLCAAVLPPEVYCDEQRTAEAFDTLDFGKQGKLSPESLKQAFQTKKEAGTKIFAELISEFDTDGDGALDLSEFRQMLRGGPEVRTGRAVEVVRGVECSPFGRR